MAGTDASASGRAPVAAAMIIRENLFQEEQILVTRLKLADDGCGAFHRAFSISRVHKPSFPKKPVDRVLGVTDWHGHLKKLQVLFSLRVRISGHHTSARLVR
jgi:hypothetical protein